MADESNIVPEYYQVKLMQSPTLTQSLEEVITYLTPSWQREISNYIIDWYHVFLRELQPSPKTLLKKIEDIYSGIRRTLADRTPIKLAEGPISRIKDILINHSLCLSVKEISRDSDLFRTFLSRNTNLTCTLLNRCIDESFKIHGIILDEPSTNTEKSEESSSLCLVLIHLEQYLWIPTFPELIVLDSGLSLNNSQILRMLHPILDHIYPRMDRGLVRILGPAGGSYPCGQIFSDVLREEITDSRHIDLCNGYRAELFAVFEEE